MARFDNVKPRPKNHLLTDFMFNTSLPALSIWLALHIEQLSHFHIEPFRVLAYQYIIQVVAFASSAGGLRNRNAAAFASLKKLAALVVFNPDFVGTEPKEAANPVTVENQMQ